MTDTTLSMPLRSLAGFRITLAGMAVMMAGASAPSPFYPSLQHEIGFSAATLTGIFAVYTVALLASLLVTGSLSDHVGRRPVISAGFGLMALSLLLFWQAGDVTGLMIARALQGVAAGLLLSALSAPWSISSRRRDPAALRSGTRSFRWVGLPRVLSWRAY